MKLLTLIFGGLLLGAAQVYGQQASKDLNALLILSQPLPGGDLLSQAPDPAHWTITSTLVGPPTTPTTGAPVAPAGGVTNITKSAKLFLVESVGSDGKKMTRWKDRQFQATYIGEDKRPVVAYSPTFLADGSVLYYLDFSKTDFPEFSWINARNYVGMTKLGAGMGLVFKATIPAKGLAMAILTGTHGKTGDAVAVVDAQTHRPLMLQVDNELLTYQFASGGADVTLPKEVQVAFAAWRKQIQRASVVPPG